MTNITRKIDLFATPSDKEEIVAIIESMPTDQRIIGLTIMSMTWNFLAEQVNATKEEEVPPKKIVTD